MKVKSYRELTAWQRGMELAELVYRATEAFPAAELYGLVRQLRRAAVSVPSNIAEGQGRSTTGEFVHFLGIARGSLFELETQLLLSDRLGFLLPDQLASLLDFTGESGRLLNGLIRSLTPDPQPPSCDAGPQTSSH